MRTRTQAKPVSRKKKNQEHPVTAMNGGTKTFPAVNPVQQHKNGGVAQLYRTNIAHEVSDGLELNSHQVNQDSPFARSYQETQLTYNSEGNKFIGTVTDVNSGTEKQVEKPGLPPLKISENDQMAVSNESGQHREFFATDEILRDSKEKLKNSQSAVRLGKEGGELRITDGGPPLYRTVPFAKPEGGNNYNMEKLERISSTYCNKVVDRIMVGSSRVAVLSRPGPLEDSPREETEVPMGAWKHQDPTWIREYISTPEEQKPEFDTLGSHYNRYLAWPESEKWEQQQKDQEHHEKLQHVADQYGELDPLVRDEQAEKYGINEFAVAEPGEAYMTSSGQSPGFAKSMTYGIPRDKYLSALTELQSWDPMLDIAGQKMSSEAQSLIDSWSYHFAAVVARDGADTVTLENYNRGVENENHVRDIFHQLFFSFGEFHNDIEEHLLTGENKDDNIRYNNKDYHKLIEWMGTELPKKQQDLQKEAGQALEEALQSIRQGLNVSTNYTQSLLYFQMYGPGDQSLHGQFKKTGFNPVTVRVRESHKELQQTYLEKVRVAKEQLPGLFSGIGWKMPVTEKYMTGYLYQEINRNLNKERLELKQLNNLRDLKLWKNHMRNNFCPEINETGLFLMNKLIPFRQPIANVSETVMLGTLDRVNELNTANTPLTFVSELKEKFGDLDLTDYNIKKDIRSDMRNLGIVLPRVRQLLDRIIG